jgi:predicted DNA-binding protein (MmcQ/YjbR family)
MTFDEFNDFCGGLIATTYIMQWGGAHVWKVGGKVFAIGWDEGQPAFTFKAGDMAYEILREQSGLRPAPYLASRGLKWIQHYAEPGLTDDELREYIRRSHRIVTEGLSRKKRKTLGLPLD